MCLSIESFTKWNKIIRGVAHSISHGSPREKSEKKSEKTEKFGQIRNFEKTEKF